MRRAHDVQGRRARRLRRARRRQADLLHPSVTYPRRAPPGSSGYQNPSPPSAGSNRHTTNSARAKSRTNARLPPPPPSPPPPSSSAASAVSASSAAPPRSHPASGLRPTARFSALARARLPRWPPHLLHHLELVLIARGGVKAFAIRAETKLWASTLQSVARSFFAATRRRVDATIRRGGSQKRRGRARRCIRGRTGRTRNRGAIDALRAANRVDRLLNLARGVGPVTLDGRTPPLAPAEIPP